MHNNSLNWQKELKILIKTNYPAYGSMGTDMLQALVTAVIYKQIDIKLYPINSLTYLPGLLSDAQVLAEYVFDNYNIKEILENKEL